MGRGWVELGGLVQLEGPLPGEASARLYKGRGVVVLEARFSSRDPPTGREAY